MTQIQNEDRFVRLSRSSNWKCLAVHWRDFN